MTLEQGIFENYIINVATHCHNTRLMELYGSHRPCEYFMRDIESRVGVTVGGRDDYRRYILRFVTNALNIRLHWESNRNLGLAIQDYIYEVILDIPHRCSRPQYSHKEINWQKEGF